MDRVLSDSVTKLSLSLSMDGIRYQISDATNIEDAAADYWSEMFRLMADEGVGVTKVSTVLLMYPFVSEFLAFEGFVDFSSLLEIALNSIDYDNVYFHPEFEFVDMAGQNYALFDEEGELIGHAGDAVDPVSYARLSPYPMVNILRTPLVKAAQRRENV
jgi:hypothetical protein